MESGSKSHSLLHTTAGEGDIRVGKKGEQRKRGEEDRKKGKGEKKRGRQEIRKET